MTSIKSYDQLEEFGRVRLSKNFFMRDFLHSEIAAWHEIRNLPEHPDVAVAVGKELCSRLLEPLQASFGRIHIRSGYRSPQVNEFGNRNRLNCASNASNFAAHIWDYLDAQGLHGATACIVIPWLVDHVARGGHWTDMAWWIHDHLPYSSMCFFPKLSAFNISWHEEPARRIDSFAPPKGCLTRPGMENHGGSHADQYVGFPRLDGAAIDGRRTSDRPSELGRAADSTQPKPIAPPIEVGRHLTVAKRPVHAAAGKHGARACRRGQIPSNSHEDDMAQGRPPSFTGERNPWPGRGCRTLCAQGQGQLRKTW